jgi:hypothetical protein
MGYKTRSNYAPLFSMSEEEYNKIFPKEKPNELTNDLERGTESSTRCADTETDSSKSQD